MRAYRNAARTVQGLGEDVSALVARGGDLSELPGIGEAPFTPSSSPKVTETMEITIMCTGRVTGALAQMQAGAEVGVRGPMGRAYPIDEFAGRDIPWAHIDIAGPAYADEDQALARVGGTGHPVRTLLRWLLSQS